MNSTKLQGRVKIYLPQKKEKKKFKKKFHEWLEGPVYVKAGDRMVSSGSVVCSAVVELRFLALWLGRVYHNWMLFLNRKPWAGSNSVMDVLALCLGKNDSVPGAYEMSSMIVSVCSLLILICVCREILSHLIWDVFFWRLLSNSWHGWFLRISYKICRFQCALVL